MSVSIIAAVGKNFELGKNNDLIWHFKDDMKFFKETTTNHIVIMGRKTFESLPKALPNRRNIVITSKRDYSAEGAEVVASIDEALDLSKNEDVFIIGGGQIYKSFLDVADKLYLTEIDDSCEEADTFFPSFDKSKYTRTVLKTNEQDGIQFVHALYQLI